MAWGQYGTWAVLVTPNEGRKHDKPSATNKIVVLRNNLSSIFWGVSCFIPSFGATETAHVQPWRGVWHGTRPCHKN